MEKKNIRVEGLVMNYDHLTIKYHNNRLYSLKRWIGSFPHLRQISNGIASYLESITRHIQNIEQIQIEESMFSSRNPNLSMTNPTLYGSGYGCPDEITEIFTTASYYYIVQDVLNKDPRADHGEAKVLYECIQETISNLITEDTNILHFVNFGVAYAYLDTYFAEKFPKLKCIGLDRSQVTKLINEIYFPNVQNYQTSNNNIFDFLNQGRFPGGIFFTSRTLTLLPKSFIEELFAAVSKAGFKYIVGFEPIGISRQTLKPYCFSDESQPSVGNVYRNAMFIHNYPYLLKTAGYQMIESALIRTGHPEEDHQFIKYIGEKNE